MKDWSGHLLCQPHQAERDIQEWAGLQVGHHCLVSALQAIKAAKARWRVPLHGQFSTLLIGQGSVARPFPCTRPTDMCSRGTTAIWSLAGRSFHLLTSASTARRSSELTGDRGKGPGEVRTRL